MDCSASPRLSARPTSSCLVWPSREEIPRPSLRQAQSLSGTLRRNWLDDGWLMEVRGIPVEFPNYGRHDSEKVPDTLNSARKST